MNIPQYITQLTSGWIRDVSKRLSQGTCVRIDETTETRTIGVDVESLKKMLIGIDLDDLYADLYPSGTKGWVDLTTAQTIGGQKTFSAVTKHNTDIQILNNANLRMFTNKYNGVVGWTNLQFFSADGIQTGAVISGCNSVTSHGTYLRAYQGKAYSGIACGYDGSNTSQILEGAPSADDSSTSSAQIAHRGWVNNYFSRKTHHHDDVYSKLGHTHSGYASSSHTHSGYASSSHNHTGVYAEATHQHVAADITDLATTIDGKITTFSNTVSTTYATLAAYNTLSALVNEIDLDLSEVVAEVSLINLDIDELYTDLYPSGTKGWVDLTTDQTVEGAKTFGNSGCKFMNYLTIDFNREGGEGAQIQLNPPTDKRGLGRGNIDVVSSTSGTSVRLFVDGGTTTAGTPTLVVTRKSATEDNEISLGANHVIRSSIPSDSSSTTSKELAPLGWVNNYFSRKTHHHDDVYSKLGHTHSGYASTNHTHSGYASSNHNHNGVYANATHQHVAADITDLGTAIDGKITTFSNTVSTTYATKSALVTLQNLVNEIDADLADVIDYVDSMDEDIADLVAWYATGRTGTLTLGGVVSWTGTQLKQDKHVVTFTNGLITNVVTTEGMVIDTPILFEQS